MFLQSEKCWRNLYIHIPFCAGKCGYCAFYSETQTSAALRKKYLTAVRSFLREQEFAESISTVYIGGGTPNYLTAGELAELFETVAASVPLKSDCEISCELNPELLTQDKLSVLNTYATRLSLGVQSFDAAVREKLMRRCSSEHLSRALKLLEKRTVRHFNIDLIYGVEGVPEAVLAKDLQAAIDCGVDHLSCYSLTAEENSRLGLGSPVADDAQAADRWEFIGRYLAQKGIFRYEISNYAKNDCQCRHNVNVWRGETLLGAGAAAAGFDGKDRYSFKADIQSFINDETPEFDRIDPELRMLEIFAVNLRTFEGWSKAAWEAVYPGTWAELYRKSLKAAAASPKMWNVKNERIALSEAGSLFWDDAAMEILDWMN